MPDDNWSDEELVAVLVDPGASREAKKRAAEVLHERLRQLVEQVVQQVLSPYPGADQADVVQGIWAILLLLALRYDPQRGAFRPYLLTCVRNLARSAVRAYLARRTRQRDLLPGVLDDLVPGVFARYEGGDDSSAVVAEALLAFLPPKERGIFREYYLEQRPIEEVAEQFKTSVDGVHRRTHAARRRLRLRFPQVRQTDVSPDGDFQERILTEARGLAEQRPVVMLPAAGGPASVVHEVAPVPDGVLLDRLRGTLHWEQVDAGQWQVKVTFWSRRARPDGNGNREEDLRKFDRWWIILQCFVSGGPPVRVETRLTLDPVENLVSAPTRVGIIDPSRIGQVKLLLGEQIR